MEYAIRTVNETNKEDPLGKDVPIKWVGYKLLVRTFVLSWDSPTVKWKTNVVIEEILEPDSIREPDLEKITQPESQPLSGEEPPIDQESQDAYVPQSEEQE
ncbi:Uncharacterized protein Fot_32406 [Forsythia ovata]|uniref:Uncharacterized protein n=1 Tax=Forsythia ovata TaxID=205694 RepID=A0ABD1T7Q3_9LAMI